MDFSSVAREYAAAGGAAARAWWRAHRAAAARAAALGVPCALAAVAAWYFAWAWGDVAQACAAPASEYCTRPEPHAYFAASRDATCRALAARCQLSVPALAVRALLADALFTPKHVALALLHLALDVWPLWALLALVLAAAVAVRATFHALTDGPRSLVRLLSADKGE